jgi:hypothetical protein
MGAGVGKVLVLVWGLELRRWMGFREKLDTIIVRQGVRHRIHDLMMALFLRAFCESADCCYSEGV